MIWIGIIFCVVALDHVDDQAAGHVRMGWASLAIGLVFVVMGTLRKEEL